MRGYDSSTYEYERNMTAALMNMRWIWRQHLWIWEEYDSITYEEYDDSTYDCEWTMTAAIIRMI